ncbi:exported protein [Candidatus Burkholderia verschuerenii]|uniref:Exported protein n=2 Tax=Candidatus Burkholderia verschuerenii TaxID=242163 RepID=A0A0L0M8Z3_9BURK|nr:exported protein [Candidatus Burkholderia verschuerenii]
MAIVSRILSRILSICNQRLARAKTLRACVIALALPFAAMPLAQAQAMPQGAKQPSEFPHTKLTAGMYVIDAAIASNDADREQGLMYRTQLAPNEGMLFVFNENAVHCFWMKNTLIPLSIAFIRADGTITDIDEMQAETENNHCPRNNGVFALEMSKGWFAAKGIKPGTKLKGLPQIQVQ